MRCHVRIVVRLLLLTVSFLVLPITIRTIFLRQPRNAEDEDRLMKWTGDDDRPGQSNSSTQLDHGDDPLTGFRKVPFRPFEPHGPKMIVILTYQRCGSSPLGQFFNSNPKFFYFFEPLDSLYSSLYGTKQGWNIPSDLTSYANGTERRLPAMEVEQISIFLRNLLLCDFDSIPTETLVNRFFFTLTSDFAASSDYIACLDRKKLDYSKCENYLETVCGGRFGEKSGSMLGVCSRFLRDPARLRQKAFAKIQRRFTSYRICMNQLRFEVEESCLPLLQKSCSSRQLRATKVVRAPMKSMDVLLRTYPNFRVVHLIRDPRAVTLSRREFDASARGLYSTYANDSMTNEAAVYCRDVVRDILVSRTLQRQHPGKIYMVIHDEVFSNPVAGVRDIYRFIGEQVPRETMDWLEPRRFLGRGLFRWQDQLSFQQNRDIVHVCREFFQLVKSDKWSL